MKRALASKCLVAVVVAFLLVCPHLRMYTCEGTRYHAYWGRGDALAFASITVILGLVFLGIHVLARRIRVDRIQRAADAAFFIIFGLAIIACIETRRHSPNSEWLSTTLVAATSVVLILGSASLFGLCRWPPRAARAVCLILSPLLPLVLLLLVSYPPFSVSAEPVPAPPMQAGARGRTSATGTLCDVYLFIFDEWSYARTSAEPDMEEALPNLARFMRQATVYHDARSPFPETGRSLPAILFQTTDQYAWRDGEVGFRDGSERFVSVRNYNSLFSVMKERGYRTYMAGWGHPYRRLLGSDADFCYSAANRLGNPDDQRLAHSIMRHLRLGLARSTLAVPKPVPLQWRLRGLWGVRERRDNHTVERLVGIHDVARMIIREEAGPTFAVLHYSIPHGPLVFTRNGLDLDVRSRFPLRFGSDGGGAFARPNPEWHIQRYRGNLQYMDTLLGEVVSTIKSVGRFENALIILTSDHSWRVDPELDCYYMAKNLELGDPALYLGDDSPPRELTHVPLVVKYPGQVEPAEVGEAFSLTNLRNIIDAADSRRTKVQRDWGGGRRAEERRFSERQIRAGLSTTRPRRQGRRWHLPSTRWSCVRGPRGGHRALAR